MGPKKPNQSYTSKVDNLPKRFEPFITIDLQGQDNLEATYKDAKGNTVAQLKSKLSLGNSTKLQKRIMGATLQAQRTGKYLMKQSPTLGADRQKFEVSEYIVSIALLIFKMILELAKQKGWLGLSSASHEEPHHYRSDISDLRRLGIDVNNVQFTDLQGKPIPENNNTKLIRESLKKRLEEPLLVEKNKENEPVIEITTPRKPTLGG